MTDIYLPELNGLEPEELSLLIDEIVKQPKSNERQRLLLKLKLLKETKTNDRI